MHPRPATRRLLAGVCAAAVLVFAGAGMASATFTATVTSAGLKVGSGPAPAPPANLRFPPSQGGVVQCQHLRGTDYQVTLAWDPSPDMRVTGYNVQYTAGGVTYNVPEPGDTTSATLVVGKKTTFTLVSTIHEWSSTPVMATASC